MKTLLALDLSTTCTGWAVFDIETRKLIRYGSIKPSTRYNDIHVTKYKYPQQQLLKMINLSEQIRELIHLNQPTKIVIEEIAGSKQRLGQKVLDGLHWIVLYLNQEIIPIVSFYDVSGLSGWRTDLKLRLNEADKINNKENKKTNKKLGKGVSKLPIVDWKTLACRHVNSKYGLNLNPEVNQSDSDVGDAISIGDAYLSHRLQKSGI